MPRFGSALVVLTSAAVSFTACVAAVALWFAYIYEDVGEVQGPALFHVGTASSRIHEWASQHNGVYPSEGELVARLVGPTPDVKIDPWGRPYKYEVISPDGTRARVFSLGKDGKPGGERIDADIVYWMGPSGVEMTWDATTPPKSW